MTEFDLERLEKACEECEDCLCNLAFVKTTEPYRDQYGYPTGKTYEVVVAVRRDYEKIYDAYRNLFNYVKAIKENCKK